MKIVLYFAFCVSISCSSVALAAESSQSAAARTSFAAFDVYVPRGWQTQEKDNVLELTSGDRACGVALVIEHAQGASVKGLAESLTLNLRGEMLPPSEQGREQGHAQGKEGKYWQSTFTAKNGVRSIVRVTEGGQYFAVVTVSGYCPLLESEVLPSIVPHNEAFKGLLLAPKPLKP